MNAETTLAQYYRKNGLLPSITKYITLERDYKAIFSTQSSTLVEIFFVFT